MLSFKKLLNSFRVTTEPFPTQADIAAMTMYNKQYQNILSSSYTPTYSIGTINNVGTGISSVATQQQAPAIVFYRLDGTPIVKLNTDGSVEWANDNIDITAAAEAFGASLVLSSELKAGITQRVKLSMRDSVFDDLINIAKEKGSLTAEDLTYLLEASKIVERLKGGD